MKKSELAKNIAQSLTLGVWTSNFIQTALIRRLPSPLHRVAPSIADDLINALPNRYAPSPQTVANALLNSKNFDRVEQFCRRRNIYPNPDLTSPVMAPIAAFANLDIPQLPTIDRLAEWLLLPVERLDYYADIPARHEEHGDTAVNHYHYVLQQKKSGGKRVIEAPKQTLKSIQRLILQDIMDKIPSSSAAFGFVKGRNCLDGATRHTSEDAVVCFDLRDFFPSIAAGRVFGLLRCLGYPNSVARYLTAFCTTMTPSRVLDRLSVFEKSLFRSPHLPQGSPVSPALANQIAFNLDRRLSALADRLNANYSRYADDLAFSGDKEIVETLLGAVPQIVDDEGFCINPAKTRVMSQTSRQVVTGVIVNQHLNVSRANFDRLKAIIHACSKPTDARLNDPVFRSSLLGKIDWVTSVNPKRGWKLRRLLAIALADPQQDHITIA